METKELAKHLGISHQMANRYKAKGMPTDSLESALAWRKKNIDPFRSDGLEAILSLKYQSSKTNKSMSYADVVSMVGNLDDREYKIATKMLPMPYRYLVFSDSAFRNCPKRLGHKYQRKI